jgi:DNA mismatch endonuclease (patch repair protein)
MDDMTREQRHKNMSHIRSKDTKPEVLLRKALWKRGDSIPQELYSSSGKTGYCLNPL